MGLANEKSYGRWMQGSNSGRLSISIAISISIVANFMNHVSLADTTWLRRMTKKVAMVEEVVEEFTELEVIVKERKVAD